MMELKLDDLIKKIREYNPDEVEIIKKHIILRKTCIKGNLGKVGKPI